MATKNEERETVMQLAADDRIAGGCWSLVTDDPVIKSKLRKIGLKPVKRLHGGSAVYEVPQACLSFRKPMSATQREARSSHLHRQNVPVQGDFEALHGEVG